MQRTAKIALSETVQTAYGPGRGKASGQARGRRFAWAERRERVSFPAATPCHFGADAEATALTHVALTGCLLAAALLLGVGAGGSFVPPSARRLGILAAAAAALLASLPALFVAAPAASLTLLPQTPFAASFALDALSLPLVALLCVLGLVMAVALPPAQASARAALLLAGLLLGLLAANGVSFAAAVLLLLLPVFLPWPLRVRLAADETLLPAVAGGAVVGFAVLLRLLVVFAGPVPPGWLSLLLLGGGAAATLLCAWRGLEAETLGGVAVQAMAAGCGLAAVGVGLGLAAKGADLPELAALGFGAALLLLLAQALAVAALLLAAAVVGRAAGSNGLERLGGLLPLLPSTAAGALAATVSLAFLPPSPGFAALWLLLQALLRGLRLGGPWLALPLTLVVLVLALAVALLAAAALRGFGIVFLGRPRAPRTAGAEEQERPARLALLALVALEIGVGLWPGPVLVLLAPTLRLVGAADLGGRAGVLVLAARGQGGGYSAVAAAVLLALAVAAVVLVLRRCATPGHRVGPAWGAGAPPPAWLPFGDPNSEYGPQSVRASVLAPLIALGHGLGQVWRRLRRTPRPLPRRGPGR